ncbi:Fungal lipase-type domain-containing protein [Caenorhabditis elegans]|uniref:Fungal lipase-type domain-containing protein n=3 Tax=Caenorhabditis elegans TaxID=6239 RepID=Q4R165_CAEEL|nr:Fungal lipase-like domain-containing protein [Caenorhabditis elegans]CCD83539.1 Fungal lipase-like domain-containing protein [Caenorhabditis elegans]|eukprot:NP_001033445.2 Uncharacterized protein CELE_Y54G2A.45 [Caenorhabditis elegans]
MQQFVLFVLFFAGFSHALKSCETCLGSGYHYCADSKLCNTPACVNTIKEVLNCPHAPNATYDDNEARTKWLPLFGAGATNAKMAQKCFDNNWPTLKVSKRFLVNCSDPSPILPPTECAMITAVDVSQKILVMTFRATLGNTQLGEEVLNFLVAKKQFFDVGKVFEFFYDAYLALWRAGLEQEIRSLKYRYPDYELWVTGHSLGASLASVGASWVVKAGIFNPDSVKVFTAGQPRTGDYNYALWHQNTFAYSFRVVHHHDIVPHVPLQNAPVDHDRMYHHRTEVWYNNDMSVGSSYQICPEADGLYCVNQQVDLSWNDHTHYFNTDLNVYGDLGCPKK